MKSRSIPAFSLSGKFSQTIPVLVLCVLPFSAAHAQTPTHYEPTLESLNQHSLPQWYQDAKLGIFVHWGLYSVPGWAPHGTDIDDQVASAGWESMFANNPYAEWYQNTLRIGDTPTRRHHQATYGRDFAYDDFAPMFRE